MNHQIFEQKKMVPLRNLANWWFVVVAISLSNASLIEASVPINISLEVDNPVKVLVNTPIVHLHWNYSIVGDEELKEVDFHYGAADVYIGYIDAHDIVVSSKFKERYNLERPATLIIHNVTASDTGIYTFALKTREATKATSTVYLDVLVPARFIGRPTNKTINETEIVTFICDVTGNPTPTIKWFRGGQTVGTGKTLSFPVFRNQSGHYLCVADNDLNVTLNASAYLEVHYPSEIESTPSAKTVIEGNNASFYCNATGKPEPIITWVKHGSQTVLDQGERFSINNISQQQDGNYKCSAWNNVGHPAIANFSITVHFEPMVVVQECPSPVTEGSNVTLHCIATGNPPPSITWIWQDTGDVLARGEQLVLTAVNRSQAGSYQCLASNGIGNNSTRTCSLDALYLPTGTSMTSDQANTTLLRESNLVLNCSADANPQAHVYHFYFNGNLIGNSSSGVFNTTVVADGVYTCVPVNTVGTRSNATVSITAVDAPSVDIYTTTTAVIEGYNSTFLCNASGKPQPIITWTKLGTSKVLSNRSSLTIVNVSRPGTPDNMIQYQCTASNGVGTPATATVNVTVHFPPAIDSAPSAYQVVEGNGAILFCNATGNPQPNITWTKQGNSSKLSTSETLNLTKLMREEDGSVYKCTVTNEVGSTEATTKVTVFFPPKSAIHNCPSQVTEGDNVTLYCNATGNPPPKVAWIRSGEVLVKDGANIISAINRSQSGIFKCITWNGIGNNYTANCTVDVHYPPASTIITTRNTTVLRDAAVSIKCTTDANPDAHIYHFYLNDNLIGNSSSGVFNTTVLADGVYTCVPVNTVGTGDNATVAITAVVAPLAEVIPQTVTVTEGGNITLVCNASGVPSPSILWTQIGSSNVVSQNSSLTIVNVSRPGTPDNMIQYQCTASNGVGTPATATVNVTVHFPPAIDSAPSAYQVVEGNGAILFCNATGNPQPNITWTKQGNDSKLSTSETLNLTKLMREDDKSVYKCTVTNYVGSAEAAVMVAVWFKPEITSQQCSSPVTEGDNATLHCNATGNPPPIIAWIKASTRETLSSSGMLFIEDIKRNESGSYECLTWNGIGNNNTNSCTIDVHYLPTALALSTTPANTTVLHGTTLELNCTTDANPGAHIYYFHFNGKLIGNSSSGVFNTSVEKDGEYACVPVNTVGTGDNATVSITTVVAPSVVVSSTALIVQEGSNISLTCNASGKPQPIITWTKVGTSEVLSNTSSLTIVNVSRPGTPDNMIQYQCTASNGVGTPATATVNVTVHFLPVIDSAPSAYQVVEGNGAILFCNATGNPQPNITWTKQGNNTKLSTSETLNLTKLMREDDGSVYKCTVTNEVGSAEDTTTVTVFFPPKSAIHNCPSQVTEGDNVTLYCNATGNPAPKVAWVRSGEVLVKDTVNVISAVNRSQSGIFKCMTWNGIGNNYTANCTVDVHYPPTSTIITTLPSNTTVLRDAAVSLKCTTDANPDAHIYHFYLNDNLIGNSSSGVFNTTVVADGVYTCVPVNTVGPGDNATVGITAVVAPFSEVIPQTITVTEGGNITLVCNASGVPSPSILWTQIGSSNVVSHNSLLTIVNVSRPGTPDNMIQYQCTASNGVGTPATATVNVTVHFVPEILQAPSSTSVIESNNATLLCQATGSPQPNITWTKVGDNKTLSTSETLHLENLTREDDGTEYKCLAVNSMGSAEASAVVSIHYPSLIESAPVDQVVLESSNLTLHCNATGNPKPNITWTKDGSSTVLHQGETYSIVNIQRQAAGDYKCTAWNGVGVQKNVTATVTVHYNSLIVSTPSSAVVLEHSNHTLYCNATGNPTPNITWTKDSSSTVLHQGETYSIVNIQRQAAGDYKCTAWNGVGEPRNVTSIVTVHYPSTIRISPSNTTAIEGGNLTLHCNATGNPTPNITWTKDDSSTVLHQGETYSIVNIQRQAAGDYKCTAWNGVGEPRNVTSTVTVHFPATMESSSSNTVVTEGRNVTLHCNATGNPTPNITWRRNGSSTVLHQGQSYIVYNINRNQVGNYICSAWNGVGNKENATITVTVRYLSVIASAPVNQAILEGGNLTLHCNITGNPTPNVTWTKDANQTVLHKGETYTMVDVQRQAAGDYMCTAWNGVGEQKNVTITVDVHYAAVIVSSPNNRTVVEYDTVTFFCNATSNPPSHIIWTQDGNSTVLHRGETFIIKNITRNFNGRQIKCTTKNSVTQNVQARAHLTVHYSPEVLIKSISPVVEGNDLSLVCHVTGNPPPDVLWMRGSANSVLTRNNTVVLQNVTRTDSGLFQCYAWNGIGKNASSKVTVDVLYPAEIVTHPVDQVVWVGEPVTLFCNATGNPAPNISFSAVGQNGTVGNHKILVINSSSVACVKTYTCTANNGLQPPAAANATVTVLVRPCSSNPCLKGSCTDLKTPTYNCSCNFGYEGRNCDKPIPQQSESVKGEVKLKQELFQYHPDYKNHSSKRFKELSSSFEKNVAELYKDENQFGHVKVDSILNGSVLINFSVVFLKGNKTVDELVKILENSVSDNGTLNQLPVERDTLRLILPTTPAPTVTTTLRAPSVAAQRKEVASWMIALIGGIGGLIFLVLVCAIIHCCVHKNRKENKEDFFQGYEDETGRWVDLPHVKNGIKPSEHEFAQTNTGTYLEEGPTVEEPLNQEPTIEERPPGVRIEPAEEPDTNGNSTHL